MNDSSDRSNVAANAIDALNRHGYPFQYRVIQEASDAYHGQGSPWAFECAELPVMLRGHNTHIDFVLRLAERSWYLVAECKRIDPALSHWTFFRAPFVRRNQRESLRFDELNAYQGQRYATVRDQWLSGRPWHLAQVLKATTRGDGTGRRDAVEEACTQVMRAVGGLLHHFDENPPSPANPPWVVVPVVFTTAQLWTVEASLEDASLETGKLMPSDVGATQVPWLWLEYHRSVSLAPDLPVRRPETGYSMDDLNLTLRFSRSIAIVSTSGITDFLQSSWHVT